MNKDQYTYRERVAEAFKNDRDHYDDWYQLVAGFALQNIQKDIQISAFKEVTQLITAKRRPTKYEMAMVCAIFFEDSGLLQYYYQSQIPADKAFIEQMTWDAVVPYVYAKIHYGEDLLEIHPKHHWELVLRPRFKLWKPFIEESDFALGGNTLDEKVRSGKICFIMPPFMREAFAKVIPKREGYVLRPIEVPKQWVIYQSETAIFEELPAIMTLLKQGSIKSTQQGYINFSSLKSLQKKLKLKSFPNDIGYVKALLVASHLVDVRRFNANSKVLDIIRAVFQVQDKYLSMLDAVLFPFKGIRKADVFSLYPDALKYPLDILRHLPKGQWITLDNIHDYAESHYFEMNPVGKRATYGLQLYRTALDYMDYLEGGHAEQQKVIRTYMVTGSMLLAASFGMLDLAYDPEDPLLELDDYLDMHEGTFSACRLTPLGEYIYQDRKDYTPPASAMPTSFELQTDSLRIKVIGNMELAGGLLKNWTTNDSPGYLRLDIEKILKACASDLDLIDQIKKLQQVLGMELPENWQLEIMELLYKSASIHPVNSALVFRLSPFDRTLHRMIAQDETLKKLVLKAEQYTILVDSHNQSAFFKRMAELGYIPQHSVFAKQMAETAFQQVRPPKADTLKSFKLLMQTHRSK